MEDLVYKLNKYTIKLNKFINNNELIENNFDKYLLYLNKFNYYYYLTGGGKKKGEPKPQLNAEQKEGLATTNDANKKRAKRAEARAKEEREAKAEARTKEQSDSDNSDTKKKSY